MSESARTVGTPSGYATAAGVAGVARGRLYAALAALLGVASAALLVLYFAGIRQVAGQPIPPATTKMGAAPLDDGQLDALRGAAEKYLDAPVVLRFDGKELRVTWRELGLAVDEAALARLRPEGSIGDDYFLAGGRPVPVALERQKGLEQLVAYKDQYDRPPEDARVDLENKKVIPERTGFGIDVFASLGVVERTAQSGRREVDLAGGEIAPQVTRERLGHLDVSHVMGWFETKFNVADRDRSYNLRLAAEKVNGHVIMPGEVFSFNEAVGERTEKQGYRVAGVIQAGEMIDGLAGGACQISSTLHGAAFFAGLEIVKARPHSRPSTYITMGMDATVVWPTVDVKLKNPYPFPVAIRYVVGQGTVRVEILGQARPYEKIVFVREVTEETPFETVTREDHSMPIGSQVTEQLGFPGYKLIRRRQFYRDGKLVKEDKWRLSYPPTTEYIRIGTNPDPNLVPPKQPKLTGPMNPGGKTYTLAQ